MQCASMNRRIGDALVETSGFAKTWNGYRQSRCRLDAQGIPTEDAETETGSKESDAASDTENYGWGGRSPSQILTPYKALKTLAYSQRLHALLLQRVGTIDNPDFSLSSHILGASSIKLFAPL